MRLPNLSLCALVALAAALSAVEPERGLFLQPAGQPMRAIVVPDDADAPARFAADELAKHLAESMRLKLPILPASAAKIPKPAFLLGANSITAGLGIDPGRLEPEGFLLKTTEEYVVIVGDDHPGYTADMLRQAYYHPPVHRQAATRIGTVYGVYAFLRDVLGIDWCFPGPLGQVTPKHEKATIPTLDRVEAPSFPVRRLNRIEAQLLQTLGRHAAATRALRAAQEKARKAEALPVRILDAAPTVDGRLTERAWQRPPDGKMVRIAGGAAGVDAYVRIARDAQRFYVAVQCMEPRLDRLSAARAPAPGKVADTIFGENDVVEVFLDTNNDCDTYWQFALDAAGQTAALPPKGAAPEAPRFEGAVGKAADSWTVEIAVPLPELGGTPSAGTRWGINVTRTRRPKTDAAKVEYFGWFPSGTFQDARRFGRIAF